MYMGFENMGFEDMGFKICIAMARIMYRLLDTLLAQCRLYQWMHVFQCYDRQYSHNLRRAVYLM